MEAGVGRQVRVLFWMLLKTRVETLEGISGEYGYVPSCTFGRRI